MADGKGIEDASHKMQNEGQGAAAGQGYFDWVHRRHQGATKIRIVNANDVFAGGEWLLCSPVSLCVLFAVCMADADHIRYHNTTGTGCAAKVVLRS